LDREARQQNIIGAFEIRNPEVIRGKRLLIIDDVFTTGATIREAVSELWTADPVEIDVLTLARTLDP
jgi:predicted amidophosphoribosyltransferase